MPLCDFIGRFSFLELAQAFRLVTPDPFSSRELGGVWARDYQAMRLAQTRRVMRAPYDPGNDAVMAVRVFLRRVPKRRAHRPPTA